MVRTDDGLIVKRAAFDRDGQRVMVSDHPAREDVPYPNDADPIGEVRRHAEVRRVGELG